MVVVLVLHANPRIRHVASLDALGRRAGGRRVPVDEAIAELVADRVEPVVVGNPTVAIWTSAPIDRCLMPLYARPPIKLASTLPLMPISE